MAEENKKLRQIFPKGTKAPSEKTRPGSVGKLGDSLKQNDPETLKFIGRHTTKDHGDIEDTGAFKVATKYALDDERNKRFKPKEGVYEEDQLDERNWIAGAIKHPGREKRAAARAGMSTHAYMEKHKGDKGSSGKAAQLGLRLSKMHHEDIEEDCSICGGPHSDEKHKKDKSQGEPAYKKDKSLLLGGKKIKEDTIANRLAMEILENYKEMRVNEAISATTLPGGGNGKKGKKLKEAQNLNPYASEKIGGGGMGGGFGLKGTKSVPSLKPAGLPSQSLKAMPGGGGEMGRELGTNSERTSAFRSLYKSRDTNGAEPEGGKAIGKEVDKIDMGNPKFPKTVKGKVKEEVKLCNKQDTHDTEFTKGMEVGKAAEGETQTQHKPDGPTASNKSKKLDKRDTKSIKEHLDRVGKSFNIGSQFEPVENQVDEGENKVEKTMHEFKHGTLHSGSKKGPKVTNRKQAIAIALNQQRKAQHEDFAEPLLGEDGKKSKKKKQVKEGGAPADTPMNYSTVPNRTQNTKSDTGFAL